MPESHGLVLPALTFCFGNGKKMTYSDNWWVIWPVGVPLGKVVQLVVASDTDQPSTPNPLCTTWPSPSPSDKLNSRSFRCKKKDTNDTEVLQSHCTSWPSPSPSSEKVY